MRKRAQNGPSSSGFQSVRLRSHTASVHPVPRALALTFLAMLAAHPLAAAGQASPPARASAASANATLRIEAPASLPIGASRIAVIVRLPKGPTMPLLLTVSVEGDALQVVRARFLRSDARLERSGELRFEVPVLAQAAGTALLRADLSTYRCEQTCQQERAQGALQIQITAPASAP